MQINDFTDAFVKIEYKEQTKGFGYWPFHMAAMDEYNKVSLSCLALGDVRQCYTHFKKEYDAGKSTIFIAIDFPAKYDIEHDFVAVIEYYGGTFHIFAWPYDTKTGNKFPMVTDRMYLKYIVENLKHFLGLPNESIIMN